MLILAYKIRTKHYLLDTNNLDSTEDYTPQLYVRLKNWNPTPAPLSTKKQHTKFEKEIK
jgi:hypothetical protein